MANQIYYKGQVYAAQGESSGNNNGIENVELSINLADPTEMELTEAQKNGEESLPVDTSLDNKTLSLKATVPSSLIINNGVLVNDVQKDIIWKDTTEVRDIALDSGERYIYGDGGARLVCQGLRVLFGDQDEGQQRSDGGNDYYYSYDSAYSKPIVLHTVPRTSQTAAWDENFALGGNDISSFVMPEDLYSVFSINKTRYFLSIIQKTTSILQVRLIAYRDNITFPTNIYCDLPITTKNFGICLYCKMWNEQGAQVHFAIVGFDENNKLTAFFPIYYIFSSTGSNTILQPHWISAWRANSKEYEYAAGITAKYTHVTKEEFEEKAGMTIEEYLQS